MSAYSEWKCGAIDDQDYDFICRQEARADEDWEREIDMKFEKRDDDD